MDKDIGLFTAFKIRSLSWLFSTPTVDKNKTETIIVVSFGSLSMGKVLFLLGRRSGNKQTIKVTFIEILVLNFI